MPKTNAPIDFTLEMKRDYTIIAPDIFPIHMELVSEVFRLYGYKLKVVHYSGKEVIDTGLKYLHNDICYPAILVIVRHRDNIMRLAKGTETRFKVGKKEK